MTDPRKAKPPEIIDQQLYADEELIWWGKPVAMLLLRRINLMKILPHIVTIVFAIFFINIVQSNIFASNTLYDPSPFGSSRFGRDTDFIWSIIPIVFSLVPLVMILVSVWGLLLPVRKWFEATRTTYALTNKRVIIVKEIVSTQVQSFYDEHMQMLETKHYANGVGDLIMGYETTTVSTGNGRSRVEQIPIGFLAVPDVRLVEDLATQVFFDDETKM